MLLLSQMQIDGGCDVVPLADVWYLAAVDGKRFASSDETVSFRCGPVVVPRSRCSWQPRRPSRISGPHSGERWYPTSELAIDALPGDPFFGSKTLHPALLSGIAEDIVGSASRGTLRNLEISGSGNQWFGFHVLPPLLLGEGKTVVFEGMGSWYRLFDGAENDFVFNVLELTCTTFCLPRMIRNVLC